MITVKEKERVTGCGPAPRRWSKKIQCSDEQAGCFELDFQNKLIYGGKDFRETNTLKQLRDSDLALK